MRVLVVLAQVPDPEGSAAGRCAYAMVRGLRARGIELDVLAADVGSTGRRAPAGLDVEVVAVPNEGTWGARWLRATRPRGVLWTGEFGDRVRELARHADVVHLDELDSARAGDGLATPRTLHLHCFSRRDTPRGRLGTPAHRRSVEMTRAERWAATSTPHLVTNSSEVGDDFARLGGRPATLVPLALDLTRYEPGDPGERWVAGLIGTASWAPTEGAVRRLLDDIWPRVRRLRPDAELRLAGRGMEPERFGARDGAGGVRWLGEVETAEGFLNELGVLVYPLERGSGTKVKVLESMALGIPVVTTPAGAEGLPAGAATIHETGADLAQATVALLADADARRDLGARARAAAEHHHAPERATAPLEALLRRVADGAGG